MPAWSSPLWGHGAAVVVAEAAAIAAGGGPNADLDAGEKIGVLSYVALVYASAQLVLLGICVAVARWLGREALSGIVAGWVLGLAASLCYMCGGFGA